MHIDWWTLLFQTVNVLILVWLLARFLFRPVMGIVEKRQQASTQMMEAAEAARRQAEADRAEAAEARQQAAAKRSELLRAAEAEAETHKAALMDHARQEAERLQAAAQTERDRRKQEAERQAADRASLLAVDIAAKLVERLPDDLRVTPFLAGLADAAGALPQDDRRAIAAQAERGPLSLMAPRELTDEERRTCETGLSDALGTGVSLAVQVRPELLAGLEIHADQAVVRNSLQADLETIAAELTRDE